MGCVYSEPHSDAVKGGEERRRLSHGGDAVARKSSGPLGDEPECSATHSHWGMCERSIPEAACRAGSPDNAHVRTFVETTFYFQYRPKGIHQSTNDTKLFSVNIE